MSSQSTSMPFTPQQAMEFMQKMWNPLGMAVPGASPAPGMPPTAPFPNPMAMFATLDPLQLDRKIDELRVIEGWLAMSLNFMQMSIKTLEWQRASLEALRAGAEAAAAPAASPREEAHPRPHPHPKRAKPKPKQKEQTE